MIFAQPAPVYGLALLMAAVSTVLPIVLMSEGIRRIGASHASIIGSVGPVATIFLGFVFLDEPITAFQLAWRGAGAGRRARDFHWRRSECLAAQKLIDA